MGLLSRRGRAGSSLTLPLLPRAIARADETTRDRTVAVWPGDATPHRGDITGRALPETLRKRLGPRNCGSWSRGR
eukprot:5887367-Alexandrium_andersonii.AAC.1